jgi:hypothetical protein
MPPDQRTIIYYLAIAAAVVLAIVALMYYGGVGIASVQHTKRALACFVLAVVAAVVAYFTRPEPRVGYDGRG